MSRKLLTRRAFLASSCAGALTTATPTSAWVGRPGANGRFPSGHAGLGQRGALLLGSEYLDPLAFFDVDANQIRRAAPPARAGAVQADSFEALLANSDLDAIVIATPDHWHAPLAMAACEAGKDVYLETPCIWQPQEAAALQRAARVMGSVIQTGELLPYTRAGLALKERLAALPPDAKLRVHCRAPLNPEGGGFEFADPPADFDWNTWQGGESTRPYNSDYAHGYWRNMLDWGGGNIRSIGTPLLATLLWALDIPSLATASVSASGSPPAYGIWQCAPKFSAQIQLDERIEVTWEQSEVPAGESACLMRIEGSGEPMELRGLDESATLYLDGSAASPTGWDGRTPLGHWAEAMKQRAQPRLPLATACAAATLTQLAVASWRLKQGIQYDFAKGAVTGHGHAARLLDGMPIKLGAGGA